MSKVRKRREASPQESVGTNDSGRQTLPLSEMSSKVPKIQVCIAAAARKPVVIAPSINGPSK